MAHCPFFPRDSAAAAAAARTESGSPARSRLALQEEDVVGLVREDVLGEARVEGGEALVDLGEALLPGRVELRPGAREGRVVEPREALLLRGEPRALPGLVDRGDPPEERLVLRHLVPERGEAGRHLALDGLELRAVHRGAPDAVEALDLLEHPVGALHRRDRVREGGRRRLGGDPRDGRELLGHARLERGLEELDLDLVERRHAAVGAGPRGEEGVRGCGGGEKGGEARVGQRDGHVGWLLGIHVVRFLSRDSTCGVPRVRRRTSSPDSEAAPRDDDRATFDSTPADQPGRLEAVHLAVQVDDVDLALGIEAEGRERVDALAARRPAAQVGGLAVREAEGPDEAAAESPKKYVPARSGMRQPR